MMESRWGVKDSGVITDAITIKLRQSKQAAAMDGVSYKDRTWMFSESNGCTPCTPADKRGVLYGAEREEEI